MDWWISPLFFFLLLLLFCFVLFCFCFQRVSTAHNELGKDGGDVLVSHGPIIQFPASIFCYTQAPLLALVAVFFFPFFACKQFFNLVQLRMHVVKLLRVILSIGKRHKHMIMARPHRHPLHIPLLMLLLLCPLQLVSLLLFPLVLSFGAPQRRN